MQGGLTEIMVVSSLADLEWDFLGIELDTRMMVRGLPSAKLTELEGLIQGLVIKESL